ncbi:transducin beta-like protein 3 [Diachasmimorpha longicaudata]|uniref:transducin beta-like protein 3 n=1 Tax=Diachasmimorpha longicaudata TaxID=58733 RepID=UPI0030B8B31F
MSVSSNIKETFEAEAKHGPFYTGGNVQWSADGKHLLCQNGASISVLSLAKGTVIAALGPPTSEEDTINTFTLSPTSDTVITHHKSGLFKLFTGNDPAPKKLWKSIHKGPVPQIALSSDDRLMASGGSDSSVRLWDLHHHACTHNLKGVQGVVSVLKFHPTRNLVLAAGDDTKIHCWDITTGALQRLLAGHFSRITSLSFHDDDIHLVSSGRDKVLILWDLNKGVSLRTLPVYESLEGLFIFPAASFSLNSNPQREDEILVASGGEKGAIRVWEMRSGREVYTQEHPLVQPSKEDGGLAVTHLLSNKSSKTFAVVSVDHNIIIHSLTDFSCEKQFVGYTDEILDIVHVGDTSSHLAVATNSCDIKLYDTSTMSCQLLRGHTDLVLSLCVTQANRNLMVSSAKDNSVRVWLMSPDTLSMVSIASGTRHTASVGSVALSQASAKFFVSVSQDQCLKLWQLPDKLTTVDSGCTLNAAHTVLAHQKDINCAVVSPNDKLIATGSQDKTAKLWSSESLQLLGILRGHRRGVWCARFSPIDQVLLTTSADCTMKLWSLSELNCLKTFEGHQSSVLRAEFISRGMQLVTSGADGLLKLWSVKTSECVGTFEEHESRVWALAIGQDERRIISGGADSVMVVWRDVTAEKRQKAIAEREEMILEEQKLANLLKGEQLVAALKLALRLEKPHKVLKIVENILKKGEGGLGEAVGELKMREKEELMRAAIGWNTNSRNCQAAQLVINALLNDPESSNLETSGLSSSLEALIPYTDRHFKRVTRLLQDLHFLNYTVNYIKPHNTSEFPE